MSDMLTSTKPLDLVKIQGEKLLNAIAQIAAGQTDNLDIDIPEGEEGSDVMSDLAVAVQFLAEDVAQRIQTQDKLLEEMELRVQNRTQELEKTLNALQKSQQLYLKEEWSRYLETHGDRLENQEWLQSSSFMPAVQQTALEKAPAMSALNGDKTGTSALTIPISLADELIGLLGFEGEDLEAISDEELSAIEDIAEQVGLALENQRLFDQTQQSLAETQSLYQISAQLNAAESTEDIMLAIAKPLAGLQMSTARLWLTDSKADGSLWVEIIGNWSHDDTDPYDTGYRFEISDNPFLNQLLRESREICLISSMKEDPRTRDDKDLLARVESTGLNSFVYLPLVTGQRLIGLFVMSWKQIQVFDESDAQFFSAIGAQLATSVDGLSLLGQTRQALQETQNLYQISTKLNGTEQLQDIVSAVSDTLIDLNADFSDIWLLDQPSTGDAWLEIVSAWALDKNANSGIGFRIDLANTAFMNRLVMKKPEIVLIPSVHDDPQLKNEVTLKAGLESIGAKSIACMPLSVGSRTFGLFTVAWNSIQSFEESSKQLLATISAQIATTVDSLRLLEDTRLRAEQLQLLTEIETALSSADDENEILQTFAIAFNSARGGLHYIGQDEAGFPTTIQTVAVYEDGEAWPPEELPPGSSDPNKFLASEAWIQRPNTYTMIDNTSLDERLNANSQAIAERMQATAFCVLPLRSGRFWQGVITLSWAESHSLTATEEFLIENLREPLSAIVARHRSQITAQKARQESEELYEASRLLNEAASDLDKIIEVVATLARPAGFNHIILTFTRKDREGKPIGVEVSALNKPEDATTAVKIGDRFGIDSYKQVSKYKTATLIENIEAEKGLSDLSERLLTDFDASAAGILPISASGKDIGHIFLLANQTVEIKDDDRRLLDSLSPQIAIAVQSSLLFKETQDRANREQLLRQISEKVRNTSDVESVMRTAVTEIGRVLNRKAFVYLKESDDDTKPQIGPRNRTI